MDRLQRTTYLDTGGPPELDELTDEASRRLFEAGLLGNLAQRLGICGRGTREELTAHINAALRAGKRPWLPG